MRALITDHVIDPCALLRQVGRSEHGAAVLFLGNVRRINEGRGVTGMRYDAYVTMAQSVLERIVDEAAARAGNAQVYAVHRIGELDVGETSVAIAVSTPHRAEAFEAARYVIEEIKKRLPVWKKEHYSSGDAAWLPGRQPAVQE